MELTDEHLSELREARARLETVPFHVRLADVVGAPIEVVYSRLPRGVRGAVDAATAKTLDHALQWVVAGLRDGEPRPARKRLYKAGVAVTGAVGGFFGLPGAAAELPVTTLAMLRSIAEIAKENGLDVNAARTRLECVTVFTMGGRSPKDDAAESAYLAVRAAQAQLISQASAYLEGVAGGALVAGEAAPALVRLMGEVAKRFGVTVSRALAAKVVPAIGAATGATVNALFLDYYQGVAQGHFTVLRLQRLYGEEAVREAYQALAP